MPAEKNGLSRLFRKKYSILAAGFFLLLYLMLRQFSWGGNAVDVMATAPGMERGFRPWGQIVVFPKSSKERYSVANLKGNQPKFGGEHSDYESYYSGGKSLMLENGFRFFGQSYIYDAEPYIRGKQKITAFYLSQPFYQTNMAIFNQQGLYHWESDLPSIRGQRWCGANCLFWLKNVCPKRQTHLRLAAPRPDVSAEQMLQVAVRYRVKNQPGSYADFEQPIAFTEKRLLRLANEEIQLVLNPPDGDEWGWQIELIADRVYVPSKHSASNDSRELSVKLLGVNCH